MDRGVLLGNIRSKRIAVALGAGMVAVGLRTFAELAAVSLQAITGGLSRAGDYGYQLWLSRSRRAGRTTSTQSALRFNGRTGGGRSHGHNKYYISYRAIFIAAAALVLPLLFALGRIRSADIHLGRAYGVPDHRSRAHCQEPGI
jgi:hypothetical protein